jgi:hypothetical protein
MVLAIFDEMEVNSPDIAIARLMHRTPTIVRKRSQAAQHQPTIDITASLPGRSRVGRRGGRSELARLGAGLQSSRDEAGHPASQERVDGPTGQLGHGGTRLAGQILKRPELPRSESEAGPGGGLTRHEPNPP